MYFFIHYRYYMVKVYHWFIGVKGIDLRVDRCMFSEFEKLEGTCLWGLEILIGRDTFVGLKIN